MDYRVIYAIHRKSAESVPEIFRRIFGRAAAHAHRDFRRNGDQIDDLEKLVAELRECPNPWCKGTVPPIRVSEVDEAGNNVGMKVMCFYDCNLSGPVKPTEAEAIAAWNQRAVSEQEVKRAAEAIIDGRGITNPDIRADMKPVALMDARAALSALTAPDVVGSEG